MRELSIEKMEMVNGGKVNDASKCAGGILGMASTKRRLYLRFFIFRIPEL
ncbi:hypothetical protein [Algoriphagus marinus]|nr:hypothetical protein [Algoriphagus marinus]